MAEKLIVGPFDKGLRTDLLPFNIDNNSFPTLINSYQWRGRIRRKRGTSLLGRLQRWIGITNGAGNASINILPIPIPDGISSFSVGNAFFVDPGSASPVSLLSNTSATATLNRATGVLTIAGAPINTGVIYYPSLPVMGLEDLILESNDTPGNLSFDTTYSYRISTSQPHNIYDVSFYKNPSADATNLPGYIPKSTWTPTTWNGDDYRQFYTVNYQGALWATNGVEVPFTGASIGMQYKNITNVVINAAGPPAIATLTIVAHGLVRGDFVFINEVNGITGINFQTGYVVSADPQAANTVQVEFPNATLGGAYISGGIAQYLTNRADTTIDSLRWYDGDPVDGNPTSPTFVEGKGWVNFAPPLSQSAFSIAGLTPAIYYLVGAKIIFPFKDRLLFIGPVVQAAGGNSIYLKDTVIYSQNGTPFYTSSFTNINPVVDDPTLANIVFHPILVPVNQSATAPAYFEDSTGFGGFIRAGIDQAINTCSVNRDVLILGFDRSQSQFVYTGNDLLPFNFYFTNYELGSSSTFSTINFNDFIMTRGDRGYIISNQQGAERFDLLIPDQVFEINAENNGVQRITAQRDYVNEWVYFTYPSDEIEYKFPNQTLFYNYRDKTWSMFNESFTTYGQFQKIDSDTWGTLDYLTWGEWNDPWGSGSVTNFQPDVIAGNQQGFVFVREDESTGEATSLSIQDISGNLITSPNHNLNDNDFIIITNASGTVSSEVNGKIFQVYSADTNTFRINPIISSGTYLGGGLITRMYVPFIQTKQFPTSWALARKTNIGVQQYLLTKTENGQITVYYYLSTNSSSPYNFGSIVPTTIPNLPLNNSLIYSSILYTCPESTNLGLTPANINLQSVTAAAQSQIWHRKNTSLLGDTIQLGFTLSDEQMIAFSNTSETSSITGATQANPTVLTSDANLAEGTMVRIDDVEGMIELNYDISKRIYQVISSTATEVTIDVNSTAFTAYSAGGTITVIQYPNQFNEIELHGFILELKSSQLLA